MLATSQLRDLLLWLLTLQKRTPRPVIQTLESFSSDRPLVDLYPEEGELSDDHDLSFADPDQSLSEEQSYRETMRGIRSYMGWTH